MPYHKRLFRQYPSVVAVVVAFGVIGTILLTASHAATSTGAVEAENGTISGQASAVSDTTASGSLAVKFGVQAAASVKPTLSNTGAHSSLRTGLPALTTVSTSLMQAKDSSGRAYLDPGTPANPHVVQNIDFTNGNIYGGSTSYYSTHDLTFINCKFEGSTSDQIISIADTTPKNESVQFIDSTIGASQPVGQSPIGHITGVKLLRTYVYNGAHEIHYIEDSGYVDIDSSLLDARGTSDNANSIDPSDPPHGNAIYTSDGPAPGVVVSNTVMYGGNSQVVFDDSNPTPNHGANGVSVNGWVFDGDWFYGGSSTGESWESDNAFKGGCSVATEMTNVTVENSHFQRTGTGLGAISSNQDYITFAKWSNNVWDDNGQPVSMPVLSSGTNNCTN